MLVTCAANNVFGVPEETNIGYKILNFMAISECVKCKHCSGDITFEAKVHVDSDF